MEVSRPQPKQNPEAAQIPVDEQRLVDALRVLCMDQVQAAKSGHPGGPMGLADIAAVLWRQHLNFNPQDPQWINRDRVILSNGHCSALQYALLHLCGYDLDLDQLRAFRQLSSRTPGHPEFGLTPGVEATTGPLGQGLANSVGMALARKRMAALFNTGDHAIIDHFIYAIVGDGCLMEGISYEAMSLAGQWRLGDLIVIYDQNSVSIDGDVSGWFGEDVAGRARACHWHVIDGIDGHNRTAIDAALSEARAETGRPSLLLCRTRIGYGSPNKSGSADCHGAPLGEDEVAASRREIGWPIDEAFTIPEDIYQSWDQRQRGKDRQQQWQQQWQQYRQQHPQLAQGLAERLGLNLEDGTVSDAQQTRKAWLDRVEGARASLSHNISQDSDMATRQSSGKCLELLSQDFPELIGGSADLSGSNCVINTHNKTISGQDHAGNFLHYGAREFAMISVNNGLGLYGGQLPYSATFLVFTDYARNAVRMSSIMGIRHIMVMTHDSIALGEDGPTHQPIEHLESLRLIPGLDLWRPASTAETIAAWTESLLADGPSLLSLTRQKLPAFPVADTSGIRRGGYVLLDHDNFDAIIIATGSEVHLALAVAKSLDGHRIRVVSMPNRRRFLEQDPNYREQILPAASAQRIAIEAGCCGQWRGLIGDRGLFIGVEDFGHSAPASDVARACQIDLDSVRQQVLHYLTTQV